jgi:hypothetical protein
MDACGDNMTFGGMKVRLGASLLLCAVAQAAAAAAPTPKGLPAIDLQARCKRSESVVVEMTGDKSLQGKGFEMCMRAEQEARDALVAAWSEVPASYKSFCIAPRTFSPSYIEWIACVEMLIDLRKLRQTPKP